MPKICSKKFMYLHMLFTKVARSSRNLGIILSYPLAGLFVYILAAQTSASQAAPKFKTVHRRVKKNNPRDFKKIWLI